MLAYFRYRTKKQYKKWDMNTKTIADYTIHFKIDERFYDHYKQTVYPDDPHESVNYGF
jgi:hypothetical protein